MDITSNWSLFSPISEVPRSGSVHCRSLRRSEWVPTCGYLLLSRPTALSTQEVWNVSTPRPLPKSQHADHLWQVRFEKICRRCPPTSKPTPSSPRFTSSRVTTWYRSTQLTWRNTVWHVLLLLHVYRFSEPQQNFEASGIITWGGIQIPFVGAEVKGGKSITNFTPGIFSIPCPFGIHEYPTLYFINRTLHFY